MERCTNRRVAQRLVQLPLDILRHARAIQVLSGGIKRRKTELAASLWNEDLVLSQVTGASMVLGMGNTPGVVGYTKTGM